MAKPKKPRILAGIGNSPSRSVLKRRGVKADGNAPPKATPKKRSKALSSTPDGDGVKVGKDVVGEVLKQTPIKPAQLPDGFTEVQALKVLDDAVADLAHESVTTSKLLGRFWERLLPFVDDVQRDVHFTIAESLDMLDWAMTKTIRVVGQKQRTSLEVELLNAANGFTKLSGTDRSKLASAARALLEVESLLPMMLGKKPGHLPAKVKLPDGVKLTYADSWKIDGAQFKDAAVLLEVGPFKVLLTTLEAKTMYSGGGAAQAQTFLVRLAAAGEGAGLSYSANGKTVTIDPKDLLINHMWLTSNLVVRESGQAATTLEMPKQGSRTLRKRLKSQAERVESAEVRAGLKDLVVPTYKANVKVHLRGMREVCFAIVEGSRRKQKALARTR